MSSTEDECLDILPPRIKATRSSKACDTCRKQKSKCERADPNQPCKSCIILNTPCTSLRPSRKRGPPKGYIDRLECALHQSEALLGIILAAARSSFGPTPETANVDVRAQSLLDDIRHDPLARQILDRIDKSPYGITGRQALPNTSTTKTSFAKELGFSHDGTDISSTHPSNEWQDAVLAMLKNQHNDSLKSMPLPSSRPVDLRVDPSYANPAPTRVDRHIAASIIDADGRSPRQRRRIDEPPSLVGPSPATPQYGIFDYIPSSPPLGMRSLPKSITSSDANLPRCSPPLPIPSTESTNEEFKDRGEDADWIGAIGQLSLNEDEEVRYHGRASGLHLLGHRERDDGRNAGGIWRFPGARVWPPLPGNTGPKDSYSGIPPNPITGLDPVTDSFLPDFATQQRLLDAYFTHVHPYFPIILKSHFLISWRLMISSDGPQPRQENLDMPFGRFQRNNSRRPVPLILLFAVFSVAARHSGNPPVRPPTPGNSGPVHQIPVMWDAGDDYFRVTKMLLDGAYTSSRCTTCQALLLLAYREIGIGAMAQSWIYTGMAIRMAQDLGLHRSADGWARAGLGGKIFSPEELQERKRVWYGCVIMDKYVSSYIGRPLAIYERDFDTKLPDLLESEELEEVVFPTSLGIESRRLVSHILSCFNSSATLSGILSRIIQIIYTVRPLLRRRAEAVFLEGILDKWYFELAHHLRYEPGCNVRPVPPPHILTLHMQYWCAVLLLHRPFMKYSGQDQETEDGPTGELLSLGERSDDLCAASANHISTLAYLYGENYDLSKGPAFLCYYIFTAGVMHVTILSFHPQHPQAQIGISRCIEALKKLEIVWPSAGRALVLLSGAKVGKHLENLTASQPNHSNKRPAGTSFGSDPSVNYYPPQFFPSASSSSSTKVSVGTGRQQRSEQDLYFLSGVTSTQEFAGSLSTSVLPQMYSTGLLGDRQSSVDLNGIPDTSSLRQESRYPQFWHDYSTFPQLPPAFRSYAPPLQQSHSTSAYMVSQFDTSLFRNAQNSAS